MHARRSEASRARLTRRKEKVEAQPTTANAGETGPFYRAELAAPAAEARPIAGDLAWNCSDTRCAAGKGNSRPVIVCARLAKEVGPVASFVADGEALDEDQLARCNGA